MFFFFFFIGRLVRPSIVFTNIKFGHNIENSATFFKFPPKPDERTALSETGNPYEYETVVESEFILIDHYVFMQKKKKKLPRKSRPK